MKTILCNKYELLRPIAEGGMGSVYLVKDLHLNRLAVVKISKRIGTETKEENKRIAYAEMEILKELSHPALPGIIDFFEEGTSICIVMEYVEGITLEQYLRKFGKVETAQAVAWVVELADVLEYLHEQKPAILYRDIKPANIMIQPDGKLKLIDFGAAFVSAYGSNREQLLMGTPGYSAPEQWHHGSACRESDIYGLGAVLHEMLTGIRPVRNDLERRPVREYDKSIPRELEKIIIICTREKVSERYRSMVQLKEALSNYHKKGKVRRLFYGIKQSVGVLLWGIVAVRAFLPFLKGVSEQEFPFPYLEQPLLWATAALLYQVFSTRKGDRRKMIKKQEKSIFLTEKKFSGLYLCVVLAICLGVTVFIRDGVKLQARAAQETQTIWVEMRDEQYRKLLVREDAIYQIKDSIKLEINQEDLPDGKSSVQIIAVGEDETVYTSRVFLVEKN